MAGLGRAGVVALWLVAGACSPEEKGTKAALESGVPAGDPGHLIAGTPAGDIEAWVADIRAGLAEVEPLVETDRAGAHKRILDLYVTRQEYIEMYYGPSGRMNPAPELAEAVKLNEMRFHELFRLTGATPAAASDSVRSALRSLSEQLDQVEQHAQKSGDRVRAASVTSGQ